MRIKGEVTDAKYISGVNRSTGNPYELTEYELTAFDEQGHSHKMLFTISGEKMRQEAVHKGDKVEVSIQIGIREFQRRDGNVGRVNEIVSCYFVQKLDSEGRTTKEAVMARQEQKQAAQAQQPMTAAPVAPAPQPAQSSDDLPF